MESIYDCFKLNNDMKIPCVGFGTYKAAEGNNVEVLKTAIEAGYRYFDTASFYQTEDFLGQAIRESNLPREDFFLVSKMWKDEMGYQQTKDALEKSLKRLGTDYLDIYLIHWPRPSADCENWKELDLETWRAMEELQKEGKIRGLGLSNFLPHHIKNILENGTVKPVVNQLELHPGYMQQAAVRMAANKCGLPVSALDLMIAGDLLGQCVASSYAARSTQVPYLGVYGACSPMIEGLLLAGCMIDGGYAQRVCAAASSHFCTAERQYRFPLAYGGQRTPTAQWTATAAGACIVSHADVQASVRLTHACFGKICDLGVTDANNMGAAMAPAAYNTIRTLLSDTGTHPGDYDVIYTGDLGRVGSRLLCTMAQDDSIVLADKHQDCGILLFSEKQDVHAGGSGCGCVASVLCAHILPKLAAGELRRVIVAATGALMSPTSVQQGESIPGICHAAVLEHVGKGES